MNRGAIYWMRYVQLGFTALTLILLTACGNTVANLGNITESDLRAAATSYMIEDLDTLGGSYSVSREVSSNGKVVVGYSNIAGDNGFHAFRWADGTMQDLGTLGGNYSSAEAVSSDGKVVVGNSNVVRGGEAYAFLWSNGTMQNLGTLGGNLSSARAVSSDGKVVVGESTTTSGTYRAFRWADGTMQDLGTLGGNYSSAEAVSSDGKVVVGISSTASNEGRAFLWSNGTMQDLGTPSGSYSIAEAVSSDGKVVVGNGSTTSGQRYAFRWANGIMQDLGTLGGGLVARTVSSDGSVVVGYSLTDSGIPRAFRWADGTLQDLGTLGGHSSDALAVSSDGSVIVGYSITTSSRQHAFIYTNGTMQDLGSLSGDNSVAEAVSSDGSAVAGRSLTSSQRAVRWTQQSTQDAQTIAFDAPAGKVYGDAPFAVSASATSGLPVSFTSETTGVCTVAETATPSEAQVTLVGSGTCTLTANQAGDATYTAATPVVQSFEVAKATSVIDFTGTPTTGERGSTVEVTVTSTSDAAISLSVTPESANGCTLENRLLNLVMTGDCVLSATQVESTNYLGGNNTHKVTVVRTLTPTSLTAVSGTGTYGGTASLTATLSADDTPQVGKTVSFLLGEEALSAVTDVNGVVTASDVSLTGKNAGSYTLIASFAGDDTAALDASSAEGILTVAKADQTLTFTSTAPSGARVGQTYAVAATATSGLSASFSSLTTDVCTVSGSTVTFTDVGSCTVAADQAGDGNYNAAPQATQTTTVVAPVPVDTAAPTISLSSPANRATYTQGQGVTVAYSCADEAGGSGLASCVASAPSGSALNTSTPGSYSFTVKAADHKGNQSSVTNYYKVVALPKQTYVIDFTTSGSTTISSVKVGSGVSYKGRGIPVTGSITVYGKRKLKNLYQDGNYARVMTLYGSKRLTVVNSSGKQNQDGGHLAFSFYRSFGDGLVDLKNLTLSNATGGGVIGLYNQQNRQLKLIAIPKLRAGETRTITLNQAGVGYLHVYAYGPFGLDDITFDE